MRVQATKFTVQEMREISASGVVSMKASMGKTFTNWFLIKCGLIVVATVYAIDLVVMSMLP